MFLARSGAWVGFSYIFIVHLLLPPLIFQSEGSPRFFEIALAALCVIRYTVNYYEVIGLHIARFERSSQNRIGVPQKFRSLGAGEQPPWRERSCCSSNCRQSSDHARSGN